MTTSLARLFGLALSAGVMAQNPQYATFASGCPGSLPVTHLTLVAPPVIGLILQVDLDNLPADAAILFSGFSRTNSPFGPLPLALGRFGMPGCQAFVSPDAPILLVGSGNRAVYAQAVPSATSLVGFRLFQQSLVVDPGANAIGLVASDAAELVIGMPGWPTGGTPLPDMVPIAAGSFQMGSGAYVATHPGTVIELPVHQVTITQPFWMGKYEATQAEYALLMLQNPSTHQGANLPVEGVTWNDALAFCAALTAQEAAANRLPPGYVYRLATEAEWEYCCRAGTTSEWNVGSSLNCSQANFLSAAGPCVAPAGATVAVGSYAPNAWGLYDMHGNVFEWCLDRWDGGANYTAGPVQDPYVTSGPYPSVRSGAWDSTFIFARSAYRNFCQPSCSFANLGFRYVLAPIR